MILTGINACNKFGIFSRYVDHQSMPKLDHLVPVKCTINEDGLAGTWFVDYPKVLKSTGSTPPWLNSSLHVEAKCVKGCNSDADCGDHSQCEPILEDCQ